LAEYDVPYYEGTVHYVERYGADTVALDAVYTLDLPERFNFNWVRLTVTNNTFVKLSTNSVNGTANISLYKLNVEQDDTPEIFNSVNHTDFENAIQRILQGETEHYYTLEKDVIYYIIITKTEHYEGMPKAGTFTAAKILENETELAEHLYNAGIRTFEGGKYEASTVNYGQQTTITVRAPSDYSLQTTVHYTSNGTGTIYTNYTTWVFQNYAKFAKLYRFGEDIFAFGINQGDTTAVVAEYFQTVVDAVLNGYGYEKNDNDEYDFDDYYMWAFTKGGSGTEITIMTYYGIDPIVYIPSNTAIIEISNNAFNGNTTVREIYMEDNIRRIGSSAFSGCTNLETVVLSSAITSIGSNAFNGCSGLEYVYYRGTYAKFAALKARTPTVSPPDGIQTTGNSILFEKVVYYSESTPSPADGEPTIADEKYWHYVNGTTTLWA
jgi:hypothetical protein